MFFATLLSMFACSSSFDAKGRDPSAFDSYDAVLIKSDTRQVNTPLKAEGSRDAEGLAQLELEIVYTTIDKIEPTVDAQEDVRFRIEVPEEISDDAPIMKVERDRTAIVGGIVRFPQNLHEILKGEYQIEMFRPEIDILSTSQIIFSIVEAGDMEIDVLYIPLKAEQLEGFIFEAIDYASSQGVLCFDVDGYPI